MPFNGIAIIRVVLDCIANFLKEADALTLTEAQQLWKKSATSRHLLVTSGPKLPPGPNMTLVDKPGSLENSIKSWLRTGS